MLIDANTVPKNGIIQAHACIVGAGAAGITLAHEFVGQSFSFCLLESGNLEFDSGTQSLYKGENVGLSYPLNQSRLRYFGGTTNHWGGNCRPLDWIDFVARDWIPDSGWPFGKARLDPFYERAQSICQLGRYAYETEDWELPTEASPLPFIPNRVTTKIFQHSPPTRFGKVYRDEITHAENSNVILNANVVDIETSSNARSVTRLSVATLRGNKFSISARVFILATGGIENARLLLLSDKVHRAGLGNYNDLVGRYFMEHPHFHDSCEMLLSDALTPMVLYNAGAMPLGAMPFKEDNSMISGVLALSDETQRHEKLTNVSFVLKPYVPKGLDSLESVLLDIYMGDMPRDFWHHLREVIADVDNVARAAYAKLIPRAFRLLSRSEQAPNPASRVTLSDELDTLGKRKVRLDWQLSAIDIRSVRRAAEIIAQEVGRARLGRVQLKLGTDEGSWPPVQGGMHHMGTTRMHVDPKRGVVDENCRVHGIDNLFIAGSSVFPTCGYANPTITIVALALKLADHVKEVIR